MLNKNVGKVSDENTNPCYQEYKLSLNCLSKKNYVAEECELYFKNYNACQSFWNKVRKHRRLKGITPLLPPPSEREAIKTKYLKAGSLD